MSSSVGQKRGKYDPNLEAEARKWIIAVLQVTADELKAEPNADDFVKALKNGAILCRLINALQPGSVPKINYSKMAFKEVSNSEKTQYRHNITLVVLR